MQASVCIKDAACTKELSKCLAQGGVADMADGTKLAAGHGRRGVAQSSFDSLLGGELDGRWL